MLRFDEKHIKPRLIYKYHRINREAILKFNDRLRFYDLDGSFENSEGSDAPDDDPDKESEETEIARIGRSRRQSGRRGQRRTTLDPAKAAGKKKGRRAKAAAAQPGGASRTASGAGPAPIEVVETDPAEDDSLAACARTLPTGKAWGRTEAGGYSGGLDRQHSVNEDNSD